MDLRRRLALVPDADRDKWASGPPERFLKDAELCRLFEVDSVDAYEGLPKWQQTAMRKKAKLHIIGMAPQ